MDWIDEKLNVGIDVQALRNLDRYYYDTKHLRALS